MPKVILKYFSCCVIFFISAFFCSKALAQMLPSEYYTNDSIINLRIYQPLKWQKDSSLLAEENIRYYDSVFQDSNIEARLVHFNTSFIQDTFQLKYDETLPAANKIWKKESEQPKWLFVFITILIAAITVLKLYNIELFRYLFTSVYSSRECEKAVGEAEANSVPYHLFVMLINSVMFSLVIYYLSVEFDFKIINAGPIAQILIWMLIVAAYFFIKNLIFQILSNLFGSDKLFQYFNQVNLSSNFNIAFVFIPVYYLVFTNLLQMPNILFHPLTLVSIGVLVLYKIVRMSISVQNKFPYSILYLFLYLCALEIVPWLYFIGLVKRY